MTSDDFIKIITEGFNGFTEFSFKGDSVFLRHITLFDQQQLFSLVEKHTKRFVERGIQSEEQRLQQIIKDKLWSENDDLEISELDNYISNLRQSQKKYVLPREKREVQVIIDAESEKLFKLKRQRHELIGSTAETLAMRRANEEFLRRLFYKDAGLKILCFSDSEFGDLENDDLETLMNYYQGTMSRFSDENIQQAVLEDCFNMYLPFADKPWDFYGKPVCSLSVFQLKFLVYARMFLNIFQNVEKIPDHIRKDPKALLDFVDSSRNQDKFKAKDNKEGSTSFIMGTKEDAEQVTGGEVGDLSAELKKHGGRMDQAALMKQMGINIS